MPERSQLYRPFPTAQPTDKPTPYIHEEFAPVHFDQSIGEALGHLGHQGYGVLGKSTEQVGAAMASLGKSFEHAGDEIFQRASAIKHVENQTAAVDAETKFMIEGSKATDAYEAEKGTAASGALDAHMANLEKMRQQTRSTLQNDEVRNMFDQRSLQALGSMVIRASKHAKDQGRAAAIGARDANFKIKLDDLMKRAADPDFDMGQLDQERRKLMDEFTEQLKLEGIPMKGPQGELRIREKISNINTALLNGIANRDSHKALELLNEWKKQPDMFTAEDLFKLQSGLLTKNTTQTLRVEVDKELDFLNKPSDDRRPEPTLAELEQKILKFVDSDPILRDDPNAKERAISNMRAMYGLKQQIRIEKERKEHQDITNAIFGVRNPQLPRPTSKEDLYAQNPDLKPIIEGNGTLLKMVENEIAKNNNKDDYGPTPERKERYLEVLDWFNHKDTFEKAMFLDITKEQLPFEWKKHILEVRRSKAGAAAKDDPRTATWMGQLSINGILPKDVNKTTNPTKYHAFSGALTEAARQFERETDKHIGWDELKGIARSISEETKETTFWSNIGMAGKPRHFEVPAKHRAMLKERNPNMTEAEIVEDYARAYMHSYAPVLYEELYKKPMPIKPVPAR